MIAAGTERLVDENTRLLLVGDSMAVGLTHYLRLLADEEGIEDYMALATSGTRIDQWARSGELERALEAFEPTLILVSLGTNDAHLGPGAADRQAPYLEELLDMLEESGATVVWIGPPELPFEDTEIRELLEDEAPRYFDSLDYDIPRGPDDLHPTASGYAGWAGAIWQWLT